MFTQVTDSARVYVREVGDKHKITLFRSRTSFDKAVGHAGIELKEKRGVAEGVLKNINAVWNEKAGHGVLGTKREIEKFIKLCNTEEVAKEPGKRGRKPKEESEKITKSKSSDKETAKRGRKPKSAVVEEPVKKRGMSAIKEKAKKTEQEPDLVLDIHSEYSQAYNVKKLVEITKSEFKRLGVNAVPQDVIDAFVNSQNIRDIFEIAIEVFKKD